MCTLPIPRDVTSGKKSPQTVALRRSKPEKKFAAILVPKEAEPATKTLALPRNKVIKVFVVSGSSQGMEFDLLKPLMTIGRLNGGADIQIDDPEVSRIHCALAVRREVILLQDLGSTNGTYVSGSRVLAMQLEPMSTFCIGDTALQIKMLSEKDTASETSNA
jgi:pSer/pThr/pTyr-binding forkhead associated (FHA) protein